MSTISNRIKANVLPDLEVHADKVKDEALKLRDEIGGMSNADRAAMWGTIGKSNIAPDFFDGKINKNDEASFVKLASDPTVGPIKVLKNIAKQGSVDPGAGVLHRFDKVGDFLSGKIGSYAVVQGTANRRGRGDGAKLQVQVEYEASRGETRKLFDVRTAGKNIVFDTDKDGNIQPLQARLNLAGRLCEDGIRDIHLTAEIDGVPAVDALKLLKEIGSEEIEFPAALPLKLMMQEGSGMTLNFDPKDGASFGLRGSLAALEDFDDRIPEAMLTVSADGKMEKIDDKKYFDVGKLSLSLDSKINVLWDDAGQIKLQYQGEDGKYKDYDASSRLGMPLSEGMIMMLLGASLSGID